METTESTKRKIPLFAVLAPVVLLCLCFSSLYFIGSQPSNSLPSSSNGDNSIAGEQVEKDNKIEKEFSYPVTSVVDGDTIHIIYEGADTVVRLVGIDTPEKNDPTKPVECYSEEASAKMSDLVQNKSIYIESDGKQGQRDKYNRLLLYAWVKDTTGKEVFVNDYMIREGFAKAYTEIDSDYLEQFKSAEYKAQLASKGLWGEACKCTRNEEVSRVCSGCNQAEVTYKNWDCTTFTGTAQDQGCSSSCVTYNPTPPKQTASWSCNCSKTCAQMSSCAEAQYQLNTCGCQARDGDNDGTACDSAPLKCQN